MLLIQLNRLEEHLINICLIIILRLTDSDIYYTV